MREHNIREVYSFASHVQFKKMAASSAQNSITRYYEYDRQNSCLMDVESGGRGQAGTSEVSCLSLSHVPDLTMVSILSTSFGLACP